DVIVAVEGRTVGTVGQLQQTIAERRPGDEVEVTYYRDGDRRRADVTLGENTISVRPSAPAGAPEPVGSVLGMEVRDLDEALASQLGFAEAEGAVVVDVDPYGPAARRGLVPGLRIVEINDEGIDTVEDVQEILRSAEPGSIASIEV